MVGGSEGTCGEGVVCKGRGDWGSVKGVGGGGGLTLVEVCRWSVSLGISVCGRGRVCVVVAVTCSGVMWTVFGYRWRGEGAVWGGSEAHVWVGAWAG